MNQLVFSMAESIGRKKALILACKSATAHKWATIRKMKKNKQTSLTQLVVSQLSSVRAVNNAAAMQCPSIYDDCTFIDAIHHRCKHRVSKRTGNKQASLALCHATVSVVNVCVTQATTHNGHVHYR